MAGQHCAKPLVILQVTAEGNALQQQQLARERDTFEVVAFLRAENDTLQERLKHFEGKRPSPPTPPSLLTPPSHHLQARSCALNATRRRRRCGWGVTCDV
jgi:hypothetical protein